jgi:hypothetical protein
MAAEQQDAADEVRASPMAALAADLGVLRTQEPPTMTVIASAVDHPRWAERLIIAAAAPGALAGAVLSILLALMQFDLRLSDGLIGNVFAFLAISTPMLSLIGGVTLVLGAIAAPFIPGRARYKWVAITLGTLLWGLALYGLSVPGLIDLP